jgi:hypothetical protein
MPWKADSHWTLVVFKGWKRFAKLNMVRHEVAHSRDPTKRAALAAGVCPRRGLKAISTEVHEKRTRMAALARRS